jgi:DNA-directed RNA polymerase specialized sigma24 family protein
LDPGDGRADNQDALELYGDINLDLAREIDRLHAKAEAIQNFRSYAAVVTYHSCSDYLRAKYPQRHSLKNKLRYFMTHRQGYALWEGSEKQPLCGFASWPGRKALSRADRLDGLRASDLGLPVKDVSQMNANDWSELLDGLFNRVEGPVELDDLVNIVADLLGIKDATEQIKSRDEEDEGPSYDPPSCELTPAEALQQREFLGRLWAEISQLQPGHRVAYLLNFRDADGNIQLFPYNGVASIEQIGRCLEISDEQFGRLWQELPLDDEARRQAKALTDYEEKFALLWLHLPVEDALIAKVLGCDRQKVINLRQKARERLARRLKDLWG